LEQVDQVELLDQIMDKQEATQFFQVSLQQEVDMVQRVDPMVVQEAQAAVAETLLPPVVVVLRPQIQRRGTMVEMRPMLRIIPVVVVVELMRLGVLARHPMAAPEKSQQLQEHLLPMLVEAEVECILQALARQVQEVLAVAALVEKVLRGQQEPMVTAVAAAELALMLLVSLEVQVVLVL
jgi:hypothetical protein